MCCIGGLFKSHRFEDSWTVSCYGSPKIHDSPLHACFPLLCLEASSSIIDFFVLLQCLLTLNSAESLWLTLSLFELFSDSGDTTNPLEKLGLLTRNCRLIEHLFVEHHIIVGKCFHYKPFLCILCHLIFAQRDLLCNW